MDIHKPKAAHSWREFAVEIGTIICGILIALGLEQAIEFTHRRAEIKETRAALKQELENDLGVLQLRARIEPCIQRRLAELHAMLDQWTRTGDFETPASVGGPTWTRLSFVRFEAAQSAGRLAQLGDEEQARMGTIALVLKRYDDVELEEGPIWARLRLLQNGPKGLSESDRALIREALQQAAYDDYILRITTNQGVPRARSYGFTPNAGAAAELTRFGQNNGPSVPTICQPLDTPPAEAARMSGRATFVQF